MMNGIIELDSDSGKRFGFTSDKFDGYLWERDGHIWISTIISKQEGEGNLSKLFRMIHENGYRIKVPTPFARMKSILEKMSFQKTEEWTDEGKLEVWVK